MPIVAIPHAVIVEFATMEDKRCITVQSDFTITLECAHPAFSKARDLLMRFSELVKCPEYLHTYRITKLSLWNAASLQLKSSDIIESLEPFLRYPLPAAVRRGIYDIMALWGILTLVREGDSVILRVSNSSFLRALLESKDIRHMLIGRIPEMDELGESEPVDIEINPFERGRIKIAALNLGLPIEDLAGYQDGALSPVTLLDSLTLRDYQQEAIEAFYHNNSVYGGSGVVTLPCGAGKTIVGLGIMSKLGMKTLIIATNITALRQWKRELLSKTSLTEDDIGEYSGQVKDIRPVTIATYNIITSRAKKTDPFKHFALFEAEEWGLIIYDEVHLLPAPIFHITANIQARRRLGLTATLVREDNKQGDVFGLIGPRKYDMPWKVLEAQGWIASAKCIEFLVPYKSEMDYSDPDVSSRELFREAACNPRKIDVVRELLEKHRDVPVLILGMFLEQVRALSKELNIAIIEGSTSQKHRDELYSKFQSGEISVLVLSKVGNSSVDLPDAAVAIQVSGTFGSRQEEAQRLGRVLRPKAGSNNAVFYTIVSKDSQEEEFAAQRRLFLIEQGYSYDFVDYEVSVDELDDKTRSGQCDESCSNNFTC